MKRLLQLAVLLAVLVVASRAQKPEQLPIYKPEHPLAGEIRLGGGGYPELIKQWLAGFAAAQPKLKVIDYTLAGPAAALGALYTGTADVSLTGRMANPEELQAFEKVMGYPALEVCVTSGSYSGDETAGAVVFVNSRNPITKLTMKQLDGILGSQRTGGWQGTKWSKSMARGADQNIRTWGQLGLTGEWADKTIQVYAYDLSVNTFTYQVMHRVFGGGTLWNPTLSEVPLSEPGRAGTVAKSGAAQVMNSVSSDPYAIGLGPIKYGEGRTQVKPVALASREGGPYFEPTRENFLSWDYPLVLPMCMYVNQAPGQPVDPMVKEFLRYILSREGQKIVQDIAGDILPLNPKLADAQRQKLN